MALVDRDSLCPLCGEPLGEEGILGFTYYAVSHREFEALDDSAVHQECLRNWEKKEEFVTFWNSQIHRRAHGFFVRDYELLVIEDDGSVQYEKPQKIEKKKPSLLRRIFGKA